MRKNVRPNSSPVTDSCTLKWVNLRNKSKTTRQLFVDPSQQLCTSINSFNSDTCAAAAATMFQQ